MNKSQNSKLNMYNSSLQTLLNFQQKWEDNTAISHIAEELTGNIRKIVETGTDKEKVTTGSTVAKNELKEVMCRTARILAGSGYAFAFRMKNSSLQAVFDYSFTALERVSDNVSILRCQAIHDALLPILEQAGVFGILKEEVENLQKDITNFRNAIGLKEGAKSSQAAGTRNLGNLFTETDKILNEQLDKLMLRYLVSEKEFYEAYQNARTIKQLGVRYRKEEPKPSEQIG